MVEPYKGTLQLVALVCQKFDNYGDEFTFSLMKHFTPEVLTVAKSKVNFTVDVNRKLIELLTGSLESADIEEEVGYELFKLDRKMNQLVNKPKAAYNRYRLEVRVRNSDDEYIIPVSIFSFW